MWCGSSIAPALERQRQETQEFKVTLGRISRSGLPEVRPCLRKNVLIKLKAGKTKGGDWGGRLYTHRELSRDLDCRGGGKITKECTVNSMNTF